MKQKLILLFAIAAIWTGKVLAQQTMPEKIAVLAPLYLDTAFNDYTYQLGNKNIPQYIIAGLDFYNGVMLAVDALQKEHANIEVWVYDTKKKDTDISTILKGMSLQNFSLIIASLNNTDEQKAVSDFSFVYNIPVVSATYPNDANVTDNPFFILLNSTLKTHVDGIFKYVQQNYASIKPVFITRSEPLESRILTDFKANDPNTFNLKYKTLMLYNDEVTISSLAPYLDSAKTNVLVCGSLNTTLASNIAKTLCENPQYKTTLIGMPNWDGIRQLNKLDCSNLEVVYSTPYNYSRTDSTGYNISQSYHNKFYARPSDMVYKGYEAMYHFTHLLLDYKYDFINHLSENKYIVSNNFYIIPVMMQNASYVPAYLENQNLYFVKKVNGQLISITTLSH
jgi:hypothetical protein